MINIEGLEKAEVLMVLYNRAKTQGLGMLHYTPDPMTKEVAVTLLEKGTYFDYVQGRVMKVNLKSDIEFEEYLYDRDNGDAAAASAISFLRGKV